MDRLHFRAAALDVVTNVQPVMGEVRNMAFLATLVRQLVQKRRCAELTTSAPATSLPATGSGK